MPLDSYQQLRTVGALFTEKKGNIYQIFTTIKTHFTYGHEEVYLQAAESFSDDKRV